MRLHRIFLNFMLPHAGDSTLRCSSDGYERHREEERGREGILAEGERIYIARKEVLGLYQKKRGFGRLWK